MRKITVRIGVDVEAEGDDGLAASVKARIETLIAVQLATLGVRTHRASTYYAEDARCVNSVCCFNSVSLEFATPKLEEQELSVLHGEFAAAILKRIDQAILRDVAKDVLFNEMDREPTDDQVNALITEHLHLFRK